MELTINQPEEYIREITITVEPERVNQKINEILNDYKDKIMIPGFRKGKVPQKILLKKLGKGLEAIAAERLVDEITTEVIKEKNFHLATDARVIDLEIGEDKSLKFILLLEVLPDFELKEYKGIPITPPEILGYEQEFEKRVKALQEKCAILHSVNKPAAKGNVLLLDYEVFAGEERLEKKTAYRFKLGEEGNLKELEEGLFGSQPEERREIKVNFPENHPNPKLAGREVRFKIFVRDVKEEELPELNDELAKNLGYESLTAMGEEIKESILEEREEIERNLIRQQIEDYLLKENEFSPPPSIIEKMKKQIIFENRLENNQENREKIHPLAEKKAKLFIILSRIAEKENLSPTPEEIETLLTSYAVSEEEKAKLLKSQFLKDKLLIEKVFNFLIRQANVS